jgi:hypothetical protein
MTPTIDAIAQRAATEIQKLYSDITPPPNSEQQQHARTIYSKLLEELDETTRYQTVAMLNHLGCAEVDLRDEADRAEMGLPPR